MATTDLTTLKINYLTQAQYDEALDNDEINENELYLTPVTPASVTVTNLTPASEFVLYDSNVPIQLYVYEKIASIRGAVKPASAIAASSTNHTICTIPAVYAPSNYSIQQVMQGSGNDEWLLVISTNGTVSFTRLRDPSSASGAFKQAGTSEWLPFHATWIIV